MPSLVPSMATSAALLVTAMVTLWLLSIWRRDASIVDVFWGPAFLVAAGAAALTSPAPAGARRWLALALVGIWGLRLALHLLRRNAGRGEDPRYAAMRRAHGPRFWWVSLFTVYVLQGALAWLVSWPVQAAVALPASPLGPLDAAACALWLLGFLFEAVGDLQLHRFLRQPGSHGRALDTGLWRYTRHPNYFGDACVWWGFGLLGLAAGAPWSLAGSLVMTVLLLRVSGVTLLERDIAERRPAYREYAARTSAFLPWFPRRGTP